MKKIILIVTAFIFLNFLFSEIISAPKESLPLWISNIPENTSIGIAKKSYKVEEMIDASKQFAVVNAARNNSSNIKKSFVRIVNDYGDFSNIERYKNEFNVVSDKKLLDKLYNSYNLIAYDTYLNYLLVLYSEKDSLEKKEPKNRKICFEDGLTIDDNCVVSIATESSANLIKAWENAMTQARMQIADYVSKKVKTEVTNDGEVTKKKILLTSLERLENLDLENAKIDYIYRDSLISYIVTLRMVYKMEIQ